MKTLAFLIALVVSPTISYAKVSLGGVLSTPEIVGGYISVWPLDDLSIDARATLSTLDAGVTGHIGIGNGNDAQGRHGGGRHDILVSAMGGYVHGGSHVYYDDGSDTHIVGMAGYGHQGVLDIRLLGGVSAFATSHGWQCTPTFAAMLGLIF